MLKNKEEINFFEILCSFKVAEASDLISRLDFLLDNLFLCFGHCTYRQCSTGIPMGTNCANYLANFYLFSHEFDFLSVSLIITHVVLCFIDCTLFVGFWIIFLLLNFQTS